MSAADAYLLAMRGDGVAPPAPVIWAQPADGVYPNMPADEYHAADALGSGGARAILRSPAHYRLMRDTPNEPTPALQFGSAVHVGVLEPETYAERVKLGPNVGTRTKAWAEYCAANPGFICLTPDDHARAGSCIAAVRAHPAASRLLDGAERELSVFWHDGQYGVPCKARFDIRNFGGLADLKTTADASREAFARSCAEWLYHVQAWHYWSGAEHALNASPEFFAFVVVEKEPPHSVAVRTLGRASLLKGARLMDEAMSRYRDALASGKWPAYPDTIESFDIPRYALN
jgi:PDDEXK-like domain of unknown function (DUF3799)